MKDESSTTKYETVKNDLLRRIAGGEFEPSGRIPSENQLSDTYQVSVMTARRALADLVHEGRVVRIKGKGSFVAAHPAAGSFRAKAQPPAGTRGIVTLILLSYEQNDSPFMTIISGAQSYLSAKGYSMTIECSGRDVRTEAEILERCARSKVAGVLLFSTDPEASAPKLAQLNAAGIPFVMLDRSMDLFPNTVVTAYHFDGMYQCTEHLLRLGHRRIIYMANEIRTTVHTERMQGYRQALAQGGGEYIPELCLTENYSQMHLLEGLIEKYGATAVACIHDRVGIAVVEHLQGKGYRVPEDISVTGFDDSEVGRYADLTSVRQPFHDIGETGARRLVALINGKSGHSRVMLPVELVVRGSTGPAKHGKEDSV